MKTMIKIAILTALLSACSLSDGPDDPAPPDAAGGLCSEVCPAGDYANCGFDGLRCSCSTALIKCHLDSCDGWNEAAPYCSAAGVCTRSAPSCSFDGACECLGDGPDPVECRTDVCEAS